MPQAEMNDLEALVLLNAVDAIGSVRIKKLLQAFGRPKDVFKATPHEWTRAAGLTPVMVRRVLETIKSFNVDAEIREAGHHGIKILTVYDNDYPGILKEVYDPPVVLYVKGSFDPCDQNAIGIVGSRGASFYGLSCAREFSSFLSRAGLTIVSGMARGIDTAAHRAALDSGGRTIAVLGSGLLDVYPPENELLFEEISRNGAAISEFPLHTPPRAQNFPVRNRIISGLCRGVLVVEASLKSGALITARFALEQGREVFAVPGKVSSETSLGANDLIKQGAKMATVPQEILNDLRFNFIIPSAGELGGEPAFLDAAAAPACGLNPSEAKVLKALSDEPASVDDISSHTGLGVPDLLSVLMHLELKKAVKQLPGKNFVKTTN
ncbi:MAG TPA: DNA-protecting protein DprA [Candidatus Omnitrophica bacterium]|nr:DNA-protecting protein DprA [Candidatus Omnitrophota bacterium]